MGDEPKNWQDAKKQFLSASDPAERLALLGKMVDFSKNDSEIVETTNFLIKFSNESLKLRPGGTS
ncbi:MAG: hypothetical protein WC319_08855 [Candidatus Paceibacterota bacterium]|jgi:hypothetical protein